ncbi:thymidylate kinase-like isoform X1 [Chenopodium quinoa]|uniref:thymidylate kinase-like isoform X1 n=1 Tax=Chenopodium quinoa TaxID=63459 RepID=UPI000B795F0C|nr:thymidylate kinase-like isoform X1 [Chenopodium quinoa]XP_021755619.1 thymidylate kinase-like isoform X1 [Chenopodium quinoa]
MTVKFTRAQRRNQDVKFQLNCSIFATKMENDSSKKIEVSALNPNLQSRGALVVLEGLDRSGKSSQCIQLLSHLQSIGYSAELWRFPDRNTAVGQMICAYLSNQSNLDDHTIHLLFSANRWEKRWLMPACQWKKSRRSSENMCLSVLWPAKMEGLCLTSGHNRQAAICLLLAWAKLYTIVSKQ